MKRITRIAAFLAAVMILGSQSRANFVEDCNQTAYADLTIRGCTTAIDSGRLPREFLSIAYYNRANAYSELNKFRRAIQDYGLALRIDPDFVDAYYNRANTFVRFADYRRAVHDYSQALRIEPRFTAAYANRGIAYAKLGDYRRAIGDFDVAIRKGQDTAQVYFDRGIALYLVGKFPEALADIDRVLHLDPDNPDIIDKRAHILVALGKPHDALTEFERVMKLGGEGWVRLYQDALAGHEKYSGPIDGSYSSAVKAALTGCIEIKCRLLEWSR